VGEDGGFGDFEGWIAGGEFVKATPCGGGLDVDGVAAEAVMIGEAAF